MNGRAVRQISCPGPRKTSSYCGECMHFFRNVLPAKSCNHNLMRTGLVVVWLLCAGLALGQSCETSQDMDAATRSALEAAGRQYFDYTAKGDVASMRQRAIPSLAADF